LLGAWKAQVLRGKPRGTTNIRNIASKHWKRWYGLENCCVVPFTSFSEFNKEAGGDIRFALNESRPFAFFAGLWTNWTSVRKVNRGETTGQNAKIQRDVMQRISDCSASA
jgi:putative SOS response-associated peptidase YedK